MQIRENKKLEELN